MCSPLPEQRKMYGLVPEAMPVTTCSHAFGAAAATTKQLVTRTPAPTGLICFNDLIAFGATLGLYELGLVPGQDVSVIGFDNIEAAANWRPPLSTMSIEAELIGNHAGALLAKRIGNAELPVCSLLSEAILKARETTAPPRSAG